ncbi:MAG: hypothetical protein L3K03_08930 [Thermoplasmata archaeon]|nr:hypothetical protein [Thermoplasmata archaeon]
MDNFGETTAPDPERRRRLRRQLILALVVVAVALIAALALIPIHYDFSGTISTAGCLSCGDNGSSIPGSAVPGLQELSFPDRATVSLHWQTTNDSNVSLWVYPSSGSINDSRGVCYSVGASSGDCQFVSTGGTYSILVADADVAEPPETVVFTGSYSSPLLAF